MANFGQIFTAVDAQLPEEALQLQLGALLVTFSDGGSDASAQRRSQPRLSRIRLWLSLPAISRRIGPSCRNAPGQLAPLKPAHLNPMIEKPQVPIVESACPGGVLLEQRQVDAFAHVHVAEVTGVQMIA